jgi:hypothetical protein
MKSELPSGNYNLNNYYTLKEIFVPFGIKFYEFYKTAYLLVVPLELLNALVCVTIITMKILLSPKLCPGTLL